LAAAPRSSPSTCRCRLDAHAPAGTRPPHGSAAALARVGAIIEEPRLHGHLTGRENLHVHGAARDRGAHARVEAIRAAEAHAPDVVLMDIRMVKIDGIEATRRLPRRRVRVLTTFGLDEYIVEGVARRGERLSHEGRAGGRPSSPRRF